MTFIQFVLLGLGLGGLYALSGQGLVLIHRGSGVINFAQGGIGAATAFVFYELHDLGPGLPFPVALVAATVAAGALGGAIYWLIMRPLRASSALVRLVATLGVLTIIQSVILIHYGSQLQITTSFYPSTVIHIGSVAVGVDQFVILGVAIVITGVLWYVYHRTVFGLATAAVAENQRSAAALAWSPDLIAGANWVIGTALAGLAGVLLFPIVTLSVTSLTNIVLASLAAALIGGFTSFPRTLAAGLALGIAESVLGRYATTPGLAMSVPLFAIIAWLVFRGSTLATRGTTFQKLPALGTGRIRWPETVLATAVVVALIVVLPAQWTAGFTNTFAMAVILLSAVVVSGYGGQLSLGQFALAGMGAFVAGRLAAAAHLPFMLAALLGIVLTIPVGVIFALPAVRLRGLNLAIVTLGLGLVVQLMIFGNPAYVGGYVGTNIGESRNVLGIDVDPIASPKRYAIFTLVVFLICGVAIAYMRRGRVGRRFIAVRTNERAASALGIDVTRSKVAAFAIGAALAAAGGILLAFSSTSIDYSAQFDYSNSLLVMEYIVIGGVGFVSGSYLGALLAPGALGAVLVTELFNNATIQSYVPLVGGIVVLIVLLTAPAGLAGQNAELYQRARRALGGRRDAVPPPAPPTAPAAAALAVPARELRAEGLQVRYGGVIAVDGVSFSVRSGEIIGIIGPNGAGKTTLIDAVTGFTRLSGGTITVDGEAVHGLSPSARARRGIGRSFQSLELFEDVTVYENLLIAGEARTGRVGHGARKQLSAGAVAAVDMFGLARVLGDLPKNLPYGHRRLIAIARALASTPSIVLLDEPAAGLDTSESAELCELVGRLARERGIGFVVIEHNVEFVMRLCTTVHVIDRGREISRGSPDEVRSDQKVIEAYLGTAYHESGEETHEPQSAADPARPTDGQPGGLGAQPGDATRGAGPEPRLRGGVRSP